MIRVRWYGQSAYLLSGTKSVFIDPFGDMSSAAARGMTFRYPAIEGVAPDLLLVTHEHRDHNGVEAIDGDPPTIRSTAGRRESPAGEVVAIAAEHDDEAGTVRGPNTIFRFELDGIRIAHLGDFGQAELRPAQRAALGEVDLLFLPAGGGPTVGGRAAADLVRTIGPKLVVPMHYRTEAIDFLDPPDAFLDELGAPVERHGSSELEVELPHELTVVLLAAPVQP